MATGKGSAGQTQVPSHVFPEVQLSANAALITPPGAQIHAGLVQHVIRLLRRAKDDCRPVPWVLFENVLGLLDMPKSGDFVAPPAVQLLTSELESLGYATWAHRCVTTVVHAT